MYRYMNRSDSGSLYVLCSYLPDLCCHTQINTLSATFSLRLKRERYKSIKGVVGRGRVGVGVGDGGWG